MLAGNIKKHKGLALVAFLDILGFSHEIINRWEDKEDNPLDKILSLKDKLPTVSPATYDLYVSNLPKNDHTRRYVCRVQTISDSIVVSFGFDKKYHEADAVLGLITFCEVISGIWRNTLEEGFTLRGAADYGQVYWDQSEIIGPSFITSYKLESTAAKSSRVVLSSGLNKFIDNTLSNIGTLWNDNVLKLLLKDEDGYITINPHSLYNFDKTKYPQIIEKIKNLRDKANGLNKEKYTSLLAHLSTEYKPLKKEQLGQY